MGTSFWCFGLIGLRVDFDQIGSWRGGVLADIHDARNKFQSALEVGGADLKALVFGRLDPGGASH
jgi:hypothetical protein